MGRYVSPHIIWQVIQKRRTLAQRLNGVSVCEGRIMPKKQHAKLSRQARKLGLKGKRRRAYVYGTLSKIKKRRKAKKNVTRPKGKIKRTYKRRKR